MRFIRNIFILIIIGAGLYVYLDQTKLTPDMLKETLQEALNIKKPKDNNESKNEPDIEVSGELNHWIGKNEKSLRNKFGEPKRIDKSAYGYKWLIFTNEKDQYIQFGVQKDKVETLYVIGENLSTNPFIIGKTYNELNKKFKFKKTVHYEKGTSEYTFHLKDKDILMRPLIKINNTLYAQLYFDTVTKKLSSIRLLSAKVLLKHRPYEIEYRGRLSKTSKLSDKEWGEVEDGLEKQIFDITNMMRTTNNKEKLKWEETTHNVAFLHSKDMHDNNYFSHYGLDGTGLKERLAKKSIVYTLAGENIAAHYPDAPATMEGWLNSKGHRKALLNNEYTHIGVGVFQFYYTQNFIKKP